MYSMVVVLPYACSDVVLVRGDVVHAGPRVTQAVMDAGFEKSNMSEHGMPCNVRVHAYLADVKSRDVIDFRHGADATGVRVHGSRECTTSPVARMSVTTHDLGCSSSTLDLRKMLANLVEGVPNMRAHESSESVTIEGSAILDAAEPEQRQTRAYVSRKSGAM